MNKKTEPSPKAVKVKEIIEKAKETLLDLTGFKSPRGIGVKKTEKEWVVRVEITEKSSIPEAMDVLGIYDVHSNDEGDVLSYERKGMRKRGDIETNIKE